MMTDPPKPFGLQDIDFESIYGTYLIISVQFLEDRKCLLKHVPIATPSRHRQNRSTATILPLQQISDLKYTSFEQNIKHSKYIMKGDTPERLHNLIGPLAEASKPGEGIPS